LFVELDLEEKVIYKFLKAEGKSTLDTIAVSCQTPASKAAHLLLSLELKGVLSPLPGKAYELV
tara:strand:+ start:473 stop:661 length:189 start_codon:yes stop_codon:yes gene_type:complete